MKKVIVIFMMMVFAITLSACGKNNKPTATIENFSAGRSICSFDLKVDDKDVVTEGSVMAKFYEIADKEDVLFTTKTLTGFEGNISATGLTSGRNYRVDILCTYDKEQQIIYSQDFETTLEGTSYKPIVITSAEELIAKFDSEYSLDVYYELGNDIDFANVSDFKGVCQTSAKAFSANLDGKNFKIKNVTVKSDLSYNGFFGYVKGTVKNVTFENVNVEVNRTTSSTIYVGAVAGYGYQAKFVNVDVNGAVITSASTSQYVGAIVGYANGTNIDNCDVNNLNLTSANNENTSYIGGITGYVAQNSSSKYGKIIDSTVNGTVSIAEKGSIYYGGIVGCAKVGTEIHTSVANLTTTISATKKSYIGGIAGQVNFGSDVTKCENNITDVVAMGTIDYNHGSTTADLYIGGIIGAATAVQLKNAFVSVDFNIDADDRTDTTKKLYAAAVFGNGFEYHTKCENVLIDCTIDIDTILPEGGEAHNSVEVHAKTFDGSNEAFVDNCLCLEFSVKKDDAYLVEEGNTVEANMTTIGQIKWDTLIWNVKVESGKYVVSFK